MIMKKESSSKQDVVRRLKIVDGHIKKIIEMVENNSYCIDILQQTVAVKNAVKRAEEVLLKNHINHCVVRAINTNGKEKAINELMQVFKKTN